MGFTVRRVSVISIVFLCLFVSGVEADTTALDDYVAEADGNYSYTEISRSTQFTTLTQGYIVELTSQQWRGAGEVDHSVWKHWVTIVVPEGEAC